MSIPPMIRGYPGSNRWRSNPCPTRKGKALEGVADSGACPTSKAEVAEADTEGLTVVTFVVVGRIERRERGKEWE